MNEKSMENDDDLNEMNEKRMENEEKKREKVTKVRWKRREKW
jgi:hypothetical protein